MNETNEFSFVLRPSQHGVGVFSTHNIARGTPLRLFGESNSTRLLRREDVPEAMRSFCAYRGGELICPPDFGYMPVGWYLNHSDIPNAVHDSEEETGRYGRWRAARDIAAGEEITIDYNELEEPNEEKEEYYKR